MVQDTQAWLDTLRRFGSELGLRRVDVDKLIETHRKNFEALERSTQVAAEGAKSLAERQRDIVETAFHEAAAITRDFKPIGDPKDIVARQTEFARKAFDITVQNTRDVAQLATRTTSDASTIIRGRLRASLSELGASLRRPDKT
jgi:phasin family protein